jgi:hypothetical protein
VVLRRMKILLFSWVHVQKWTSKCHSFEWNTVTSHLSKNLVVYQRKIFYLSEFLQYPFAKNLHGCDEKCGTIWCINGHLLPFVHWPIFKQKKLWTLKGTKK